MTEIEFLESLSKEQAEFYAKSIDELCEMLPKKPEETWEDADGSEEFKRTQKLIKAQRPTTNALFDIETLTGKIRQAVTVLEMAETVFNTRDEKAGMPFGFVPEKAKAAIEAMWVAHRDLEFCVDRMRMLLGEGETGYAEWIDAIERVSGHGQ